MLKFVFALLFYGFFVISSIVGHPKSYLSDVTMRVDEEVATGNLTVVNNTGVKIFFNLTRQIDKVKVTVFASLNSGKGKFRHKMNESYNNCDTKSKLGRHHIWRLLYSSFPPYVPKKCPWESKVYFVPYYEFPTYLLPPKFPRIVADFKIDFIHWKMFGEEVPFVQFEGKITISN